MERICLVSNEQDEENPRPQGEDETSDHSSESEGSRHRESCTMLCGLFLSVARNLGCKRKKRKQRQQGVSLSYTPQNGLMVRMIGDVRASSEETPVLASLSVGKDDDSERRPSRDLSALEGSSRSVFIPRATSFSAGQDAEERLLSRAVGRQPITSSHPRFLTLHRRRRKRPITRGLANNSALLDDLYNGPTQCVLSRVALWDFNAFALDSVCGGRPVAVLCVFLLHKYDLMREFSCDTVTIWKCFSLIEDGYHASNPYHNAIHAADVTQAMHCYLQEAEIDKHLTPIEKLAALIASVCHDLDHPGVNQPFLIATDNHLAALYNNASVLENHHWRCAMGCLWESGLLNNWSEEQVSVLQEMIRSLILATDITRQMEFLNKFQNYLETDTLDMTDPECRHFSLQIALKCADICNPCRPWEVSIQWSHKICDEFYRQGDYERQLRLPVTALCDRFGNSVAKIQTGFIKFVVAPLFEAWDAWLHTELSGAMLAYLHRNLAKWEDFLAEEMCQGSATRLEGAADEELSLALPVHSSSSTTSSVESHGSVLGSLENVTQSIHLGRRHSLPLTAPSLLPRTVIRRESLSEKGVTPIVSETIRMGERGEVSFSTVGAEGVDKLWPEGTADDNLFPEPTIAAMSEMGRLRKLAHAKHLRRQSLPPLWGTGFIPSRILPVQPLPQTPLQEELPLIGRRPSPPCVAPSRTKSVEESGAGGGGSGGDCSGDVGGDSSCGETGGASDSCDMDSANKCSLKCSTTRPLRETEARKGVLKQQVPMTRRASLDSTRGKRESVLQMEGQISKCPRLDDSLNPEKSSSKWTRFDTLGGTEKSHDKENCAPNVSKNERLTNILKTRLWRSLNQEDECGYRGGIYKNIPNQQFNKGRRGSAPLLKYEELRGGLRGGSENGGDYLSRRRGSAPNHHLHLGFHPLQVKTASKFGYGVCGVGSGVRCFTHIGEVPPSGPMRRVRAPKRHLNRGHSFSLIEPYLQISGSDALKLCTDEKLCQPPLLSLENVQHCDESVNVTRLSTRRVSLPGEVNLGTRESSKPRELDMSQRINRGGFVGGDLTLNCPIWESNIALPMADVRRGSSGFELVSGLWRLRMEKNRGTSICSDDSIGISSSGGATPGTPSTIGPLYMLPVQPPLLPAPFYRRGSLPTDVYTSVDMRKWGTEAS